MLHYTNILVNQMDLRCPQFIDILGDLEPTWVGYVFTVLNAVFSGSAILGNLLILVALKKDSRLHPPSKLLFRSLASTDLCVGIIAQPSFVIYLIFILKNKLIFCEIIEGVTNVSGSMFTVISLCTLTGISVDRLLALQLGMRYKHFVTVVRVRRILVLSWLLVIFSALLHFWNFGVFMGVMTVVVVLCLVTTSFCYSKIFVIMRRRRARQIAETGKQTRHMLKYRKTVYKLLWISLIIALFYLPLSTFITVRLMLGAEATNAILMVLLTTVVFLNSSLNPLVYIWKVREVRRVVVLTLRNCFSSCF